MAVTRYVDFTNGSSNNSGADIDHAWNHIREFTSLSTARTVGDVCYVRANMTEIPGAIITLDEAGSADLPIQVIGCNATQGVDPWSDGSDVRPIVNFNQGSYYLSLAKRHWVFKNLDLYNSNYTSTINSVNTYGFVELNNCVVRDPFNINTYGMSLQYMSPCRIIDCEFYNFLYQIRIGSGGGGHFFERCKFYKGANACTYLVLLNEAFDTRFKDCEFGVDGAANYCFNEGNVSSDVTFDNCSYNYNTAIHGFDALGCKLIGHQDADEVLDAHQTYTYYGTCDRVTDVLHTGGSATSAKLIPSSVCSILTPCSLTGSIARPDFSVWCEEDVETTISIYVRGLNWASYPTSDQLFIEVEYYDDDATAHISTEHSSEELVDNTTWTALSVTITPARVGFVKVKLYLGIYEDATTGIYVDLKPVVT